MTYFISKGIFDSFLQKSTRVLYADFEQVIQNQPLADKRYFEVGLISVPSLALTKIGSDLARVDARSFLPEKTIVVGTRFYTRTPEEQNTVIVHEVLHHFYQGNHGKVVKELGFYSGALNPDDPRWDDFFSSVLQNWLRADCPLRYP